VRRSGWKRGGAGECAALVDTNRATARIASLLSFPSKLGIPLPPLAT
jgi:hypothetical protein